MKRLTLALAALVFTPLIAGALGCASPAQNDEPTLGQELTIESAAETAEFSGAGAPDDIAAAAPGTKKKQSSTAVIDYSNTEDGYAMVRYTGATDKALRAVVVEPSGAQKTYDLTAGDWTAVPLDGGDGRYEVGIYEQSDGDTYTRVLSQSLNVDLAQ